MSDNYFETRLSSAEGERVAQPEHTQSPIPESEANTTPLKSRQQVIEELQESRDLAHHGIQPVEVWGAEKAKLCVDFMEFASARRVDGRFLPIAKNVSDARSRERAQAEIKPVRVALPLTILGVKTPLKRHSTYIPSTSVPLWQTRGYPIAFSDPIRQPFFWVKGKEGENIPGKKISPRDAMVRDIMLCEDGLLRSIYSGASLKVTFPDGAVATPVTGRYEVSKNEYKYHRSSGAADLEEADTQFTAQFITETLETTLMGLARAIQKDHESRQAATNA